MNKLILNEDNQGYIFVPDPATNYKSGKAGLIQSDFTISVIVNETYQPTEIVTINEIPGKAGWYSWTYSPSLLGSGAIEIIVELYIIPDYGLETLRFSETFEVVKYHSDSAFQTIIDLLNSIVPGLGSELVSVLAKESISELPVPEADYEIWDENNLIRLHSGTDPDANGQQDFLLNPGNYYIRLRKAFWNFPALVPITVTEGGLTETIYGEHFSPSSPPAPYLCVIYGYTIGVNGEIISEATVKATLKNPEVFQDISKIANITNETTSDINGYFELILLPNEQFDIPDSKYLFEVTKDDFHFESAGIVPNTTSAEFRNIIVDDC